MNEYFIMQFRQGAIDDPDHGVVTSATVTQALNARVKQGWRVHTFSVGNVTAEGAMIVILIERPLQTPAAK